MGLRRGRRQPSRQEPREGRIGEYGQARQRTGARRRRVPPGWQAQAACGVEGLADTPWYRPRPSPGIRRRAGQRSRRPNSQMVS